MQCALTPSIQAASAAGLARPADLGPRAEVVSAVAAAHPSARCAPWEEVAGYGVGLGVGRGLQRWAGLICQGLGMRQKPWPPAITETRERAGEPGVLSAVACEVPVGPEGLMYPRVFRYGVPREDPAGV